MSVAVRLSEEMVHDAQKYAELNFRSVPKQIEYWYRLGKIVDENPDLPLAFIKGVLEGKLEMERGEVSAFEFIEPS
ncbi:ParD-like family protein [Synergistaceae bacterium OttesenSCG-928-I11]|nr:ParD-like family protein [Synergistaceae bacterium OttesenSCG-928-I11]